MQLYWHGNNTHTVDIFISVLYSCTSTVAYSSLLDALGLTFTYFTYKQLMVSQAVLGVL